MKITKVILRKLNITPVWTPVICRVYTDEGVYGDGEASVAFGVGASGAFGMMRDFAKLIVGMDPLDHEVIWDRLYKNTFWALSGGAAEFAAISALDIALWDIKGKYFHVPIYRLLGGKRRDNLRCYASQLQFGWGDTFQAVGRTDEYARLARKAVAEGYDAIKIDFFTFDRDGRKFEKEEMAKLQAPGNLRLLEERVAAVREAVGENVDIIMENHSNLDVNAAVQIGKMAEKYRIFLFEEPTAPHARLNKWVSDRINIPIAHGERIFSRWQYAPYFENGSVRVIQPDIGTCGGVTECKKICDMACVYDVSVQLHVCATPLMTALSLQLESVIPNFLIHEHHRNCLYRHNQVLCTRDFQPTGGRMKVPDGPGIGCEFTEETLHMPNSEGAVVS